MSELKTRKNNTSVTSFLNSVENEKRRKDAKQILKMMKDITGEKAVMWGTSMVGFGSYDYKYASGREGTWMRIGFSPRKANTTLYIMNGFSQYNELLSQLGKYKTGKSCLYINKLEDVDIEVLKKMIKHAYFDAKLGSEKSA
ncbi:DUF1801 domain-containing protein [Aliikangiella marina]|uniref:DUF1801 domain-containing protein n=1 Tax=Aliikangiella marina TaxID=1712262 RepID=A0A545T8Z5_9GAMM|nr:DUF1801 domain-containing protein [Aliikangiella marina]TQV73690.1 DUF1801 domain-containing protein [Aliikangiella marina]